MEGAQRFATQHPLEPQSSLLGTDGVLVALAARMSTWHGGLHLDLASCVCADVLPFPRVVLLKQSLRCLLFCPV